MNENSNGFVKTVKNLNWKKFAKVTGIVALTGLILGGVGVGSYKAGQRNA